MFIKVTIKNSVGEIVPILVNASYIRTIEPTLEGKAYVIMQDGHPLVVEETLAKVATFLRMQGLYEV